MGAFFTQTQVNGVALWTLLLMCCGVFTAGLMDGIAGGGGIISVPTYILGLSGRPIYYALGTNKFSSAIGTFFSAGRYIKNGSGLAIKNGSKIVRPVVIIVLILLTLKVGSELLFPDFWA